MALCLAHAAAGYLAYEALRPAGRHDAGLLATAVVCANLPDADFLPGLALGDPTAFHRGVTHTVAAAVVVSAVVWAAGRLGRVRRPAALATVAGAAYLSHLLLDWMTVDAVPPAGIRLFWPVSGAWLHAPWSLLGEIIVDSRSREAFVRSLLTPAALRTWGRDVGVLIATVALVHLARGVSGLRAVVSASESLEGPGDA
jgi:membrane-bound metal-dependent hydrolase YbcI (DUF457 family)